MDVKLISDENKTLVVKLQRYESKQHIEDDSKNGFYLIQETYTLYVEDNHKIISDFIRNNYDIHVYMYFDGVDMDGRVKKFFSPSIDIQSNKIIIEKLKQMSF